MDTSKPIILCEHLQMSSLGIQPASISFQTVTLESDRFICFRQKTKEESEVAIIDLKDANSVLRQPITADSAIMHPKQRIIGVRAHRQLQIFDIQTKRNFKSHSMNEDVVFWKWVSDSTIGLVTHSSVYHWKIEDKTSPPQRMFDRHVSLSGTEIINYRSSPDEKWFVLVGISANTNSPRAFRVSGSMQLYNKESGISQAIKGHAGAFAQLKLDGGQSPTSLFAFAMRDANSAKLHVVEIDHDTSNPLFPAKVVDIYFPPVATEDFPVSMQVSKRHGIIYLITKYGFIHLYDLESGACVYMNRISGETIFVTAEHKDTDGIIGVNKKGQVLSVEVDDRTIIPYILTTLKNTALAIRLANRASLPGADHVSKQDNALDATGLNFDARNTQRIGPLSQIPGQALYTSTSSFPSAPLNTQPSYGIHTQARQWDVSPEAKLISDQLFDSLDTKRRGYIEGDGAVPFMIQSKLSEDDLTRIWDLVDLNSDGKLNRDCFAVAMHLINSRLTGAEIPDVLPRSLVPPNMRTRITMEMTEETQPFEEPPPSYDSLFLG